MKAGMLALAAALALPSIGLVEKLMGAFMVPVYLLFVLTCVQVLWWQRNRIVKVAMGVNPRNEWLLLAVTFVGLAALLLVIYPIANTHVPGAGSDGDDALDIAVVELWNGRYPYYVKTYLDNPISPLPGAVILAAPFVMLGASAYQTLFWLLALVFVVARWLNSLTLALVMLWVLLLVSPAVPYKMVIGSDYISNSIYVMVSCIGLLAFARRAGVRPDSSTLLLAVLLGVSLASRLNFPMLLPLLASLLVRRHGVQFAGIVLMVTLATTALLVLPFYLYDPAGFSPLHTFNKVDSYRDLLPHAGLFIGSATAVLSLFLAVWQRPGAVYFLRNCALVLALPVMATILLRSLQAQALDFSNALYGLFFLFFAVVAGWVRLFRGPAVAAETNPSATVMEPRTA